MSRYQGLVALDGGSLEDAAHEYFPRSEQIPTRVRLAVGEEWRGGDGARHRWRAGGMLLQFLPKSPSGRARPTSIPAMRRRARRRMSCRGRRLGRRPLADRHRRGCRADRSRSVGRAAAVSAVPRARRARVPPRRRCARNARARANRGVRRSDAQELSTVTPRSHNEGGQDFGPLRIFPPHPPGSRRVGGARGARAERDVG